MSVYPLIFDQVERHTSFQLGQRPAASEVARHPGFAEEFEAVLDFRPAF